MLGMRVAPRRNYLIHSMPESGLTMPANCGDTSQKRPCRFGSAVVPNTRSVPGWKWKRRWIERIMVRPS